MTARDVRLDANDYSVDPSVIGQKVDVAGDLERVRVRPAGGIVAEHARVWARGVTISRDLSDYDRAFGLSSVHDVEGIS